jgi:predicted amidophosphoribosyltransferase
MTQYFKYPEEVRSIAIYETMRQCPRTRYCCPCCGGDLTLWRGKIYVCSICGRWFGDRWKSPSLIKSRGKDVIMSSKEALLCESLKLEQRQPQLNHKAE